MYRKHANIFHPLAPEVFKEINEKIDDAKSEEKIDPYKLAKLEQYKMLMELEQGQMYKKGRYIKY